MAELRPAENDAALFGNDDTMEGQELPMIEENEEPPASSSGYSTQAEDVRMDHEPRPTKRKANDGTTSKRPGSGKKMRMSTGGRMPRAVAPLDPMPKKITVEPSP